MAVNLIFLVGIKDLFMIRIEGKSIYWNDKKSGLQMLYPNPSKTALRIGGKPTKEEVKEYNMCKTEAEIEAFVVRDCKLKGAKLIKREVIKNEEV